MVGKNIPELYRVWRFGSSLVLASFYSEKMARLWVEIRGESCLLTVGGAFLGMFRKGEGWVL